MAKTQMKSTSIAQLLLFLLIITCPLQGATDTNRTRVVLLGTGNPNPDPMHSGCSIAIIVDDIPYIVDFGPGLIRKAAALSPRYGGTEKGLAVEEFKTAFLTHLHSDHTAGYPDLLLTPWVMGRDEPLEVFGPEGITEMTNHILAAYRQDIQYRLFGSEPINDQGWRVNTHEITEGTVYKDERIEVEAFLVQHGSWPNAYGFKFTTPERVIVISGDTAPCENIVKYAKGADLLLHEVYYKKGFDQKDELWKEYHSTHHTSTRELGELAKITKPELVVLYHILFWGATDEDLLQEIAEVYDGKVVVGKDLATFWK
ncbi:MAG: MBL fold metallo-hydrolase [Anaerolineales bacterium]|nr:MBL fold metallo-hydrolase [Anaerolineales bacterium]